MPITMEYIFNALIVGLIIFNLNTASFAVTPVAERAQKKQARKLKAVKTNPNSKNNSTVKIDSQTETPKRGLSPTIQALLNRMKEKVTKSYAKENRIVAVGAVRGAEAQTDLYWKGSKKEARVAMTEVQEFDAAVSSALSGDNASAVSKLESFIGSHPESPLKDDATETLSVLKGESTSAQ